MKLKELFCELPSDIQVFNEDYAINANITLPTFDPKVSKIVGTIDQRDVWGSRCFGADIDIYAFRTDEHLDAFVAISANCDHDQHYPIIRAWCDENKRGKGLVTSLMAFITKKAHNQLKIKASEPITKDGIDWLIKLIKNPHGFSITDIDGNHVDAEEVKNNWLIAKKSRRLSNLELFIENFRNHRPFFGTGYRQLAESAQTLGSSLID